MITVQLTNGFGNNLFQYISARLLAEFHNQDVFAISPNDSYYALNDLRKLGIKFTDKHATDVLNVSDANYKIAFNERYKDYHFHLTGYFEDHTYYDKDMAVIKTWFPAVKKRNNDDLVIHFRAGDRLFYKNEFNDKPLVEDYINAIKQFDFTHLHIVTDMVEWDYLTKEKLENMKFHVHVPKEVRVPIQMSVDYFNTFIDGLGKYNPIVEKRTILEDFNFIRSFDNILFQHGTLGWWASALSDAKKVGVYGPWRPWKGASNKNLSNINLKGWFKWG